MHDEMQNAHENTIVNNAQKNNLTKTPTVSSVDPTVYELRTKNILSTKLA